MNSAATIRQLATLQREHQRDLAAEMSEPMADYARRAVDRDIEFLEGCIARLGASSLAATTGLSSFGSSRDERGSPVPASIPCGSNDQ